MVRGMLAATAVLVSMQAVPALAAQVASTQIFEGTWTGNFSTATFSGPTYGVYQLSGTFSRPVTGDAFSVEHYSIPAPGGGYNDQTFTVDHFFTNATSFGPIQMDVRPAGFAGPNSFYSGSFVVSGGKGDGTITYRFQLDKLSVPEPATWAMMLGGFGISGFTARRRRVAMKVISLT